MDCNGSVHNLFTALSVREIRAAHCNSSVATPNPNGCVVHRYGDIMFDTACTNNSVVTHTVTNVLFTGMVISCLIQLVPTTL